MPENIDSSVLILKDCIVLGSGGFPFMAGNTVTVSFSSTVVTCSGLESVARFSMVEVVDLAITGPGTVVQGGGFIGGGFGVEGALEGVAIAGVLNMLTSRKKIHTFVTLTTNFGELHLHYGAMDPSPLRIYLSPVFVGLRRIDKKWMKEREWLISSHLESGFITAEDAKMFRERLIHTPAWPNPKAETEAERLAIEKNLNDAPQGLCPNCEKVIPLHSETCRYCNANFGEYASWSVTPIG
ncbi:hypothetical protein [Achromobacter insuavis]|uniref:hypothetical protein n=1 Tax=Achromobacter insuavis TaxID=1287735 RepID=UPI0006C0C9BD|nr:hypothetical protein [Achromobacter sp.]MCG2603499.1 hypothetical protein [Achromobacter sp.]CUK24114.1 Uncharacterised protein [Achromobacter sp. 2789STDY5608615]